MATLTCTVADHVATITINRPDVLNAFNDAFSPEFIDTLKQVDRDPAVRVVVITGAGRAFSSGQDLDDLKAKYVALSLPLPERPRRVLNSRGRVLVVCADGRALTLVEEGAHLAPFWVIGSVELVLEAEHPELEDPGRVATYDLKVNEKTKVRVSVGVPQEKKPRTLKTLQLWVNGAEFMGSLSGTHLSAGRNITVKARTLPQKKILDQDQNIRK